eukprot:TRINITY_DN4134_c0_g1_i11.p1 TRINITY_DN4134_c0_g1~~TRINITY_DN4134_c0_g1_i11.p1  ORF type:complete len:614 (-),score=78.50 TRINITY_DN4134_c0_g1_i11:459-2300(-)
MSTNLVLSHHDPSLGIQFSTENLARLDPDIRFEHLVLQPDGDPGIKFYKPSNNADQSIIENSQQLLSYSPELFLVLRLESELPLPGFRRGFILQSYAYNEQLINTWNCDDLLGNTDNLSLLIYRYLNSRLLVCSGVLEGELLHPDINEILIERYGESIVYRSRKCTRIIEDLLASDLSSQLCEACSNLPCERSAAHDIAITRENPSQPVTITSTATMPRPLVVEIKSSTPKLPSFKQEDELHYGVDDYRDAFTESDDEIACKENLVLNDEEDIYKPIKKESKRKQKVPKKKKIPNKKSPNEFGVVKNKYYKSTRIHCPHGCVKSFNDESTLQKHINNFHVGPLSCPVLPTCNIKFKMYMGKQMKFHLNQAHADDVSTPLGCSKCSEIVVGIPKLLAHLSNCRKIEIGQEVACELCGQVYKSSCGLSQHIKIAHLNQRFYCDEEGCEKAFNTKNSLKSHKNCVHNNKRAFICSICGKNYKYRHEWRVCENKHAGKFLHHCQLCDKKFNIKRKYEQHMRVHTGEKPFSCPVCAYRCARLDNLNTHTKKSHGMTYKEAENLTGISATSTTKITIVPPSPLGENEDGIAIRREPIFINEVVKNKIQIETAPVQILPD